MCIQGPIHLLLRVVPLISVQEAVHRTRLSAPGESPELGTLSAHTELGRLSLGKEFLYSLCGFFFPPVFFCTLEKRETFVEKMRRGFPWPSIYCLVLWMTLKLGKA